MRWGRDWRGVVWDRKEIRKIYEKERDGIWGGIRKGQNTLGQESYGLGFLGVGEVVFCSFVCPPGLGGGRGGFGKDQENIKKTHAQI